LEFLKPLSMSLRGQKKMRPSRFETVKQARRGTQGTSHPKLGFLSQRRRFAAGFLAQTETDHRAKRGRGSGLPHVDGAETYTGKAFSNIMKWGRVAPIKGRGSVGEAAAGCRDGGSHLGGQKYAQSVLQSESQNLHCSVRPLYKNFGFGEERRKN